MRVIYTPMGEKVWLANLVQTGGAYSGDRFQRGYGLGSIFGSLIRTILPVVAKTVGKQALRTGAEVAGDFLQGGNIKQSIKTRGRQGVRNLVAKGARAVLKRQTGRGFGVRPRKTTAKTIKGGAKRKKSVQKKMKKPKSRKDAFGLF